MLPFPLQLGGFGRNISLPENLGSTKWRVYVTQHTSWFQGTLVAEIEMMSTVGGSDQCTGGTASSDWGTASNAFDNNTSTWTELQESSARWIQYEFASEISIVEFAITCAQGSRAIAAFSFQKYVGGSWETVYSASGLSWTDGERKAYTV